MRRGTIVLAFFALIAAGIIGASAFLQNQPPITVTIAVDPLIKGWVTEMVSDFNNSGALTTSGRRINITLTDVRDIQVWDDRVWLPNNHPDGWIASSSASIEYARSANYPLNIEQASLAETPLVWMGFQDRVEALENSSEIAAQLSSAPSESLSLDWPIIQAAAAIENWGILENRGANSRFVQLAFSPADNTHIGLSVLLSAAAAHHGEAVLTQALLGDNGYRNWLLPVIVSIPNFNDIGEDVGNFVARRGRAATDFAIGPESQWLANYSAITRSAEVRFTYPEYTVVFDFPLASWSDSTTAADQQSAVASFGQFLAGRRQQEQLVDYGLRPADDNISITTAEIFSDALAAGILIEPVYTRVEFPADSTSLQSLIRWFEDEVR